MIQHSRYKREYYDLTVDISDDLRGTIKAADIDHVLTSGTLCTEQIDSLGEVTSIHPIELVAPDRPA